MRLLTFNEYGELRLTEDLISNIPPYAILSHTWGADKDEVTFNDIEIGAGKSKAGYSKIRFCGEQARKDKLEYFWVDTCCINKANHVELSEAIASMFSWYRNADKCYVYLADVPHCLNNMGQNQDRWELVFRQSRWFTRGWTLQELLAPVSVEFFSQKGEFLGSKRTLERLINEITQIPIPALQMTDLSMFSVDERLRWAEKRKTQRQEDKAYCLLGIFGVFLLPIYGEGEHAFLRLKEEITKRSGFPRSVVHTHWMITRPLNTLFTGRKDILQELDRTVRDAVYSYTRQTQCRIVITGMGGQGKSEICLQLAQRLCQMFWGVFWVDVSTTSVAEKAFLDLAHKLERPAQTWDEARLEIANLKHPWLIILDNADNPSVDYQEYIPNGPLGVVLLTSRNEECQQYATAKVIALDGLSGENAQELLLKAARVPQDQYSNKLKEDAQRIAGLLQFHPLALIQAGSYISRGHCTLAQYPVVYERQRQRLLGFRPAQARSRYCDVYATFEASVHILKTSSTEVARDALQLLPILAACGPSRLPLSLFEAGWEGMKSVPAEMEDSDEDVNVLLLTPWHITHIPSLIRISIGTWDPYRLVEAVHLLKAFALVSTDTSDGDLSVSMHPLVHAWAHDRQCESERHENWLQTACLIALSRSDKDYWRHHERQLQPHVETLTGWELETLYATTPRVLVTRVLVHCGWLLHEMRSDMKLFILMQKIFGCLGLEWTEVNNQWIGLYDLAARNLTSSGKVKEAVVLLERVVRIKEQTLVEEHPDRLDSQYALAEAYRANGQVKEAVTLLETVVRIEEQTLVVDHPDRLYSQKALAVVYLANGQVKEAVALLERVVRIQEQTQAEDHPHRLESQHELARVYEANGQIEEAVELLEKVVKIREHTLAEDHPSRLASQHELAIAYYTNKQVKEAMVLIQRVVRIREQTQAEEHPSRLASQHVLAMIYHENGQIKEAVTLMESVVRIWEQTLAEEHPSRLASQYLLGMLYHADRRVKEAVARLETVVRIEGQTLAEKHPSRLVSQYALAEAYRANGQVKEAVVLLERVVMVQEHPDRLESQYALAEAYRANGQMKEAVALLEAVTRNEGQTLAEEHSS